MRQDLLEFVRALAEVLEEVDPYTRQHSLRVAEYSKILARAMGQSEKFVEELEYGALLHDLGKVGRQYQYILQKPGRLSLFRGKVRGKPLSVTLTPRHWQLLDDAAERLVLTRADVVALLIHKYGKTVTVPTVRRRDSAAEED